MRLRGDVLSLSVYFAAFVGLGLTAACLGPTLPSLAAVAGASLAQIGILVFVRSLGGMIGSLYAGPAVDHGRGRAVLGVSAIVIAGGMAIVPFSRSLFPLAGVFLVLGIGQGALNTAINTLLVWRYPDRAHSLLSMLHFSYGLGSVTAPLLVAWFLPLEGDGLFVYWFLAIVLAPLALWLAASAMPAAQRLKRVAQEWISSRVAFRWAVVLFTLFVGAETTIGTWLFSYAERAALFAPATAAYLVATFWGAFTLGRLLAVFGSAVIQPARYVYGSIIASVVSSVGVLVLPQSGPWLWIGVAAVGVSMAAIFPQAFALVSAALRMTGRRTAWLLISSSLGGMLMPWLTGLLLESVSVHVLPLVVSSAMSLAFVAFLMVRKTAHGLSMPS